MNTIRELIHKAVEIKSSYCNMTFEESIQQNTVYVIFYTNNGAQLIISMNPKSNILNKNNVYRKIDLEINDSNCIIPAEMNKYKSYQNNYYVPERVMNSFLVANGGIDMKRFIKEFTLLWETYKAYI